MQRPRRRTPPVPRRGCAQIAPRVARGTQDLRACLSEVAGDAAAIAARLIDVVPGPEPRRMRISADPADLVTLDAVRLGALIVAGGAARDVPPGGIAVERARPRERPSWRVRIPGAQSRGDARALMAGLAGVRRVAALARRRIGARLHRMPAKEVLPVDEPAIGAIDELRLYRHHRRLRMAVEAEVLLVAGAAGLLRRARHAGVTAKEVALVRYLRHRDQRVRSKIDVAGVTPRIGVLLRVVVALEAGGVAVAQGRRMSRLGQARVALRAVLLDPLDVRRVIHLQPRFALRPGSGVAHVAVAEVALPVGLLLLVALEALRFLRQEVLRQPLGIPDVLVAGDALDLRLLMAGVRKEDLVADRIGPEDGDGGRA